MCNALIGTTSWSPAKKWNGSKKLMYSGVDEGLSSHNEKIFSRDQGKMFVENFLSSKPAEFYMRRINQRPDKWLEMIENNGKYTVIWN